MDYVNPKLSELLKAIKYEHDQLLTLLTERDKSPGLTKHFTRLIKIQRAKLRKLAIKKKELEEAQ